MIKVEAHEAVDLETPGDGWVALGRTWATALANSSHDKLGIQLALTVGFPSIAVGLGDCEGGTFRVEGSAPIGLRNHAVVFDCKKTKLILHRNPTAIGGRSYYLFTLLGAKFRQRRPASSDGTVYRTLRRAKRQPLLQPTVNRCLRTRERC